jgi:hypothetical protein
MNSLEFAISSLITFGIGTSLACQGGYVFFMGDILYANKFAESLINKKISIVY